MTATDTSFPPAERTAPAMLRRQADRFAGKVLVRVDDLALRFEDAPDFAARAAGMLARAGVGRGDRVAVMCGNRKEFVTLLLGCAWLGAVIVPINVAARGAQLRHFLANSGARLLAIETGLLPSLAMVDVFTLAVDTVWLIGDGSAADRPHSLPDKTGPMPAAGELAPAAELRPGDTLAILYTSGTTGVSKGVCCPHAQFYWWGKITAHLLGVTGQDVLCTTLPLFHTNALNTLFQALLHGATAVFEARFSASAYWGMMERHGGTVAYLLGAMVPILLSREPTDEERRHRVRVALAPGVPANAHVEFVERTGIKLLDGYGSTETNFVLGAPVDRHVPPGHMGPVCEGFQARVVDADDNEVPDGEAGELILRAAEPYAFATGYFEMPEKTVEAWRNLWFHSGDRVIRMPDGNFKFVDRLKDAIRRRGENISSFEVEQVLLGHAGVAQAAVFPVASRLGEDEVMAAVVLQPGSTLTELDVVRHCEPQLAYFAVPRFVEFVEALPTTENGKVQKFKLRERGVTGKTWDREAAGYQVKRRSR